MNTISYVLMSSKYEGAKNCDIVNLVCVYSSLEELDKGLRTRGVKLCEQGSSLIVAAQPVNDDSRSKSVFVPFDEYSEYSCQWLIPKIFAKLESIPESVEW
jgi:hypothetical protein